MKSGSLLAFIVTGVLCAPSGVFGSGPSKLAGGGAAQFVPPPSGNPDTDWQNIQKAINEAGASPVRLDGFYNIGPHTVEIPKSVTLTGPMPSLIRDAKGATIASGIWRAGITGIGSETIKVSCKGVKDKVIISNLEIGNSTLNCILHKGEKTAEAPDDVYDWETFLLRCPQQCFDGGGNLEVQRCHLISQNMTAPVQNTYAIQSTEVGPVSLVVEDCVILNGVPGLDNFDSNCDAILPWYGYFSDIKISGCSITCHGGVSTTCVEVFAVKNENCRLAVNNNIMDCAAGIWGSAAFEVGWYFGNSRVFNNQFNYLNRWPLPDSLTGVVVYFGRVQGGGLFFGNELNGDGVSASLALGVPFLGGEGDSAAGLTIYDNKLSGTTDAGIWLPGASRDHVIKTVDWDHLSLSAPDPSYPLRGSHIFCEPGTSDNIFRLDTSSLQITDLGSGNLFGRTAH